jgi:quercetin dioxygenase-like cupin family protein
LLALALIQRRDNIQLNFKLGSTYMTSPSSISSISTLKKQPAFWGPGDRYNFLVTGRESQGSCFITECIVPPSGGPPMHIHTREDEMFYLLDGQVSITVDGATTAASSG